MAVWRRGDGHVTVNERAPRVTMMIVLLLVLGSQQIVLQVVTGTVLSHALERFGAVAPRCARHRQERCGVASALSFLRVETATPNKFKASAKILCLA